MTKAESPASAQSPDLHAHLEISQSTYEWTARLFALLEKVVRASIKLHAAPGQIEAGEIFVFNHFARFETFIPQYLIYRETGAFCRSVADRELFQDDSALSNYLLKVGAVPNDHPRLFQLLAAEILRGRKVVLFPEGGMVKDRDVIDERGHYSIYSRSAGQRRKHHTGAAVLALVLELFKSAIRNAQREGNQKLLEFWSEALQMISVDALVSAALRPTAIVPANITFYPIRIDGHLLHRGAELLSRGLSRRLSEELLIEGNILLRDTDMDIRLGSPVQPSWRWWERRLIARAVRGIDSLDGFLRMTSPDGDGQYLQRSLRGKVTAIRDQYMHRIYLGVSVNLSHVASTLILALVKRKRAEIEKPAFYRALYLAIKGLQQRGRRVFLHRSLQNPEGYRELIAGNCLGLDQFFSTAIKMRLLESVDGIYRFLPKMSQNYDLDQVRLENLVTVYANEVEPVRDVVRCVESAIEESQSLDKTRLAHLQFEDERLAYRWDRQRFRKARYEEINRLETATESGEPFLLLPQRPKPLGIVLVHGLLASPAELRAFGHRLQALGYPVVGVRLKGHGTSPWDLRERSWQDWLTSLRQGYSILSALATRICLVGFSTGGALALRLSAEDPSQLAGTVAISVPVKLRDPSMIFMPFIHAAGQLSRWVPALERIPFHARESEHPHINYRHIPTRALWELQGLMRELEDRLSTVKSRVLILQGDEDPVVSPRSAELIREKLVQADRQIIMIPSKRHGILNEDIGGTQEAVLSFLAQL